MNNKKQLRQTIIKKMKDNPQPLEYSTLLCQKLISLDEWKKAKIILIYMPVKGEVDVRELMKNISKRFWTNQNDKKIVSPACTESLGLITFTLPRVKGDSLKIYKINSLEDLETGAYAILEPKASCEEISLKQIDLVVVPGVAFTKKGDRLGRGKGFYDRFLMDLKKANPNVFTVSLAFDFQVLEVLPKEPHDIKIDKILTINQ